MNRQPPRHLPDDDFEHEWHVQERAWREERTGARHGDDQENAAYRDVARALRVDTTGRLPSNFAYAVAELAQRRARTAVSDAKVERGLVRALATTLALAAIVVSAVYGAAWLRALDATGVGTTGWVAALAACMLLSWGADLTRAWRSRRMR